LQILLIILFFNYFTSFFQIGQIGGFGITLEDISLVLIYIYVIKKVFWDGKPLKFSWHPAFWFLILLLISGILSSIPSILEGNQTIIIQYFKSSSHFYYFTLFALICAVYPIEIKEWSNVLKMWLILGLLIDVFAIYQIIARVYELPLAWISITNVNFSSRNGQPLEEVEQLSLRYGDFYRATSIFSEPSALGSFNTYIMAFLIIPVINKFKHLIKSKVFIVFAIIACASSQLFTFSMTGFVGFMLILIAIIFLEKVKNVLRYTFMIIAFCLVVVTADAIFSNSLGVSVVELFTKRIQGLIHWGDTEKEVPGESFGVRLLSGQKAIDVWEEYPITGIGLGLSQYNKKNDLVFADFSSFAVLAELGTIGIFAFVGMFGALFFTVIRYTQQKSYINCLDEEEKRNIGLMFYVLLVQFIINFVAGNNLISVNLWVPISMVFSIVNNANVKTNRYVVELTLVKKPLKYYLRDSITAYLNTGLTKQTFRQRIMSLTKFTELGRREKNKS